MRKFSWITSSSITENFTIPSNTRYIHNKKNELHSVYQWRRFTMGSAQKTAGNPHSCCWGKLRVGRKQRSCTYGMFSTNFKCAKLQFYLNMIAHRERWEKLLWPKDKCTVKSMTKVRRNPRDSAPIFSIYHLTAEDLIKLSQLCHDYLTAVTLFFVTYAHSQQMLC